MNKVPVLELLQFPISIHQIIKIGQGFLIENQISNAKNEIEWYLQKLYQCNKIKLYNIKDNIIKENLVNDVTNFLIQRSNKIPFQYLMGYAPFYGRDYVVNSNVLIPRPESELLIEIIKDQKNTQLLDIGTGSGCLAITARLEGIAQAVDAIDISAEAIKIAQRNSRELNINNINYIKMNILEAMPEKIYDIIISNPPYLANNEYLSLDAEIKNNEPMNALTDKSNGYVFYKRFNLILPKILKSKGIAVFEFSHLFPIKKMREIFYNFSNIVFYKDLNNDYRTIKIIND